MGAGEGRGGAEREGAGRGAWVCGRQAGETGRQSGQFGRVQ